MSLQTKKKRYFKLVISYYDTDLMEIYIDHIKSSQPICKKMTKGMM